jgi:hypothetical protein
VCRPVEGGCWSAYVGLSESAGSTCLEGALKGSATANTGYKGTE